MGKLIIKCCKDCKERYVGCHSYCEKYLDEKAIVDNQAESISRKRKLENMHYGRVHDGIENMKKKRSTQKKEKL